MNDSRLLWPDRPIPELHEMPSAWRQPELTDEWGACLAVPDGDGFMQWRRDAVARLLADAREHLPFKARYEIRQMQGDFSLQIGVAWYREASLDDIPDVDWNKDLPPGGEWVSDRYILLGRCNVVSREKWSDGPVPDRPDDSVGPPRDEMTAYDTVVRMRTDRGFSPVRLPLVDIKPETEA